MLEFFTDGGFVMYPILVVGAILLANGTSYALDCEPVRLRLLAALSLVLFEVLAPGHPDRRLGRCTQCGRHPQVPRTTTRSPSCSWG